MEKYSWISWHHPRVSRDVQNVCTVTKVGMWAMSMIQRKSELKIICETIGIWLHEALLGYGFWHPQLSPEFWVQVLWVPEFVDLTLTVNGDPGVGKMSLRNLKMSNSRGVAKNTWKSSATANREFLKVNFHFLQERVKDYLCQKLKTWSDLFGWKTEIIHGRDGLLFFSIHDFQVVESFTVQVNQLIDA